MPTLRLACALALFGVAACAQQAEAPPATSLRDVTIPADFTFQTSRTQRLQLTPPDEAFEGRAKDAPVVVSRPDGAVLYRGAVRKGARLEVEVSVPTSVDSLEVAIGKQRSSIQLSAKVGL